MKNTKRRNDLDICADILQVARAGARKTQIVYQANLNFKIVKGYLERLIYNKMLVHEPPRYYATKKATDFLEAYVTLVSFGETGASPLVARVT